MRFLPDMPVQAGADDTLDLGKFARQLCDAVTTAQPPFVFGVLGDWGTGKTSALHLAREMLETDKRLVPVWFDAWRYENETNILYPLLHAIKKAHDKFKPPSDNGFRQAFVDVVGASAFALGDTFLRGITKTLTGDAVKLADLEGYLESVHKHREAITNALEGWTDEVGRLREAFETLLGAFAADVEATASVSAADVRFVILIDDLDRCLPDTTIRLLEGIKNHLDAPNAVFVLALNAAVIYQGIRHKYSSLEVNGREYLEKILNFSFYVPAPMPDLLARFVETRLNQIDAPLNADQSTRFRDFAQATRDCHFNNPRKIKRVVNRYVMFLNRPEVEIGKFRLGSLSRLLMLAEYFPDVFHILRDYIEAKEAERSNTPFESRKFFAHYKDQTGLVLFNRYPQLAIMQKMFDLRETTTNAEYSLRIHAAEVYQVTRLV